MNSIHAAKVRIIKATVSMFVGLNTVASSGNWAFRAASLLCSHDIRLSLLKNCEACEGSYDTSARMV